jgi:Rod binding domain-containing protein
MAEIKIPRGLPMRPQITQADADAKTRDAAKMYEQYFLNQMVKSMRQTVTPTNEPSMTEKIYAEQLDSQYVENWSGQGGVGLADIIYNQLQDRFFGNGGKAPNPQGPVQIQKGTTIKIDESRQQGIPVLTPKSTLPSNEVSFLYEWENQTSGGSRDVTSPFGGEVLQSFRTSEDRSILKLAHDEGLVSTISFLGQTKGLKPGDRIEAGEIIGKLGPYAQGLTWQVGQAADKA